MQIKNLNKKIFFLSFFIVFLNINFKIFAQNNTSSPYSMYGIGDLYQKGFGSNKSMGGLGIGMRNKSELNPLNPASYTAMDTLTFLFNFGLTNKTVKSETSNISQNNNDANLTNLSIGFPVLYKKWYLSFGLTPFSSVGYSIVDYQANNTEDELRNTYKGSGDINQAYFSNAFMINSKISLGITMSYLFGSLHKEKLIESLSSVYFWDLNIDNKTRISDIIFDYGFQYTDSISDYEYTLGLTYANEIKIGAKNTTLITKNYYTKIDTLEDIVNKKGDIILPHRIAVGCMFSKDNFVRFGGDFHFEKWEDYKSFGSIDTLYTLENSFAINVGAEFLPNYRSIKYFPRIKYSIGGHFKKSSLKSNDENILDYGISLGFGLPLPRKKSRINITFELGQRGTTSNNLIKETYGIISLNFALHENWFIKRQYE